MTTEITIKRTSTQHLQFLCKQQEAKEWIQQVIGEQIASDNLSVSSISIRNVSLSYAHDPTGFCKRWGCTLQIDEQNCPRFHRLSNCLVIYLLSTALQPKIPQHSKVAFKMMENVQSFAAACSEYGVGKVFTPGRNFLVSCQYQSSSQESW
jgi:hypothetical protein